MVKFGGLSEVSLPLNFFLSHNRILRKNHFISLKFQEFFNLNLKVLELAIYPHEVSKSFNLNHPLIFFV
jgi:hypothetical protein